MKKLIILSLILFFFLGNAQTELMQFTFTNQPVVIPETFKTYDDIVLERNIKIEVANIKNQATQYFLFHQKIWVNSNDAIERNNRVYIPFRLNESVLKNEVRVINKDGKITTLTSKDIFEEVDKEKGIKYTYFAIKGLELGSVIERLYILEEAPDLKGLTMSVQQERPILSYSFEHISPKHLGFLFKTYNGLPEPVLRKDHYEGKNSILIEDKNIVALDEDDEKYANSNRWAKQFKFKLNENFANKTKNFFGYAEFANNVYNNLHKPLDKNQQKAIEDFCKPIQKTSRNQWIKEVENKLKTLVDYDRNYDAQKSFTDIIKTKQSNEYDLIRFYVAAYQHLGVPYEVVFSSRRFSYLFDPQFEITEQLKDVLIYFPETKQYLEPANDNYRYPLFNFNYGENYGLFIKEFELSGSKMGIGEIQKIEVPNEITTDIMNIEVDFTKDLLSPKIQTNIQYGGYSAINFQGIKENVPADRYQTVLKDIADNYTMKTEQVKVTAQNDATNLIGEKPFILNMEFEGTELTQQAGEKILFKLGETIGRQMEFYQEDQRKLPVEIYYPHYYVRNFKIKLPEGYVVENLQDLNMNFEVKDQGKKTAYFVSNYQQKGQEITIENKEDYLVIHYPLSLFEDYKAVINAAADFNKIVLVLSKK
ncbi:MAG: DUF3857 domain-containing protein [Flavobacteriales bacterium]|nr:DUF3857 domain-containing protein [Flavobacteriales bacterium]